MSELLQEFVSSAGVAVRVDQAASVIRGVKLLGLASRNGRSYLPAALRQAAALYEGAKVNVNHPKGHPTAARDYQDRLGSIRNVAVREAEGLFGDLHFNPKHALADQLLWDATHAPENVGFSHNVEARTSRQAGQTVVEAITKVQSVDLVADPATTRGLYESAGAAGFGNVTSLSEATLDQFRSERPDLAAAIAADAQARVTTLEAELDALRAGEAAGRRRAAAVELLREFKLPEPGAAEATQRSLVSEAFFQSLLAAPDEQSMRRLVEDRAAVVSAARAGQMSATTRPVSREQHVLERGLAPLDARSFARAIT